MPDFSIALKEDSVQMLPRAGRSLRIVGDVSAQTLRTPLPISTIASHSSSLTMRPLTVLPTLICERNSWACVGSTCRIPTPRSFHSNPNSNILTCTCWP